MGPIKENVDIFLQLLQKLDDEKRKDILKELLVVMIDLYDDPQRKMSVNAFIEKILIPRIM